MISVIAAFARRFGTSRPHFNLKGLARGESDIAGLMKKV
jgi:hypothetical protein